MKEVKIEKLPVMGSPLSIKTAKQGRKKTLNETVKAHEVSINGVTVEVDRYMVGVANDAVAKSSISEKAKLKIRGYDSQINEANCRRILRHPKSSEKQRATASLFLISDTYMRYTLAKTIKGIVRSMSLRFKDF